MGSENLLILRGRILTLSKTYEKWLVAMGKFLGTITVLAMMANKLGYQELLTKSYVILGIGVISMLLPVQYILLMVLGVLVLHLISAHILIGAVAAVVCCAVYIGYIRFYPKESIWMVVCVVAFDSQCIYMIPILAGLFSTSGAVGAIVLGVIAYYMHRGLGMMIQNIPAMTSTTEFITQVIEIFESTVLLNAEMFSMMIVLSIVFLTVLYIKKQAIDYAPYIAVVLGGFMMLVGFGLAILFLEVTLHLGVIVTMTLISVVVCVCIQAFAHPLDYTRTETVQFEDEENVYYVKVVPKLATDIHKQKVERVYTSNTFEKKEMF